MGSTTYKPVHPVKVTRLRSRRYDSYGHGKMEPPLRFRHPSFKTSMFEEGGSPASFSAGREVTPPSSLPLASSSSSSVKRSTGYGLALTRVSPSSFPHFVSIVVVVVVIVSSEEEEVLVTALAPASRKGDPLLLRFVVVVVVIGLK